MNVGSIVLATDQGLGYLAKSFFDHGIINYVLIRPHSSRINHWEWYPREFVVHSREELIEKCDSFLFFEEVFEWKIIPEAREKGKKTALMPMYECTRYPLPYVPDLILSPSAIDSQYYPDSQRCTVPVDVPWKLRTEAKVFVHNAGNGGIGGRNGTRELIQAIPLIKAPIKLIIRSQQPLPLIDDPRVEVQIGTVPEAELWSTGDVFIFPEKFNGLSLPLQEAFASGMVVMAGDRFPVNEWLPKEILIPVDSYKKERIAIEFDSAQYTAQAIASTIDAWYGRDITELSHKGKEFGEQNSWHNLKEKYAEALSQ
jgi:hypothetical protein